MASLTDLMDMEEEVSLSPNGAMANLHHRSGDLLEAAGGRAEVFGRVSPGALSSHSQDSQDSCHMADDPEKKGILDVKVKRGNSFNSSASGMPTYKMDARPRGRALIIEIEEYVNDVQDKRIGSHHDVTNLERLFEQLYFEVQIERNLDKRTFDRVLDEFSRHPGHSKADMMILAVLSHGRDGHVYASDGKVVATESIYEKFNNSGCPNLRGKPKFFIIQACRGDETDVGLYDSSEDPPNQPPVRKRRAGIGRDTIPFPNFGEIQKARPTWEDMVIAYSTIPGFASIRDHDKGTWFIQSLVETFMNHAADYELIDLLRMTSEYLSKFTNDQREKQTCNIELRHLYKRICFNPGFPPSHYSSPVALRRSKSTPPSSPRRRPREGDDQDQES